MPADMDYKKRSRNRFVAFISFVAAGGMLGAAFAAVPLYEVFCQVTGYGGTPQTAAAPPSNVLNRQIEIRFNSDVDKALRWRVDPMQDSISVKVGESALAMYRAKNLSPNIITGTAAFNVTPAKAGPYFTKIECFCFTEQKLGAGATVDMPVSFFVDPAIGEDPNLNDVTTITLSYAFFHTETLSTHTARVGNVSNDING